MAFHEEMKADNYIIILQKNVFDEVRNTLVYNYMKVNSIKYYTEITFDSKDVELQCQQTIRVFKGRKSRNNYKRASYTLNFYLTKNKIMVNGPFLAVFMKELLPDIKRLAESTNGNQGNHNSPNCTEDNRDNQILEDQNQTELKTIAHMSDVEEQHIMTTRQTSRRNQTNAETDKSTSVTNSTALLQQGTDDDLEVEIESDNDEDDTEIISKTTHNSRKAKSVQIKQGCNDHHKDVTTAIQKLDQKMTSMLSDMVDLKNQYQSVEELYRNQDILHQNQKNLDERTTSHENNVKNHDLLIEKLEDKINKTKGEMDTKFVNNIKSITALEKTVREVQQQAARQKQQIEELEKGQQERANQQMSTPVPNDMLDISRALIDLTNNVIKPMSENMNSNNTPTTASKQTQSTGREAALQSIDQRQQYYTVSGVKDPLSNFYPCNIEYRVRESQIIFKSAEHLYQFKKATFLQENDLATEIIESRNSLDAKWLGSRLDNHQGIEQWQLGRKEVMREILNLKAKVSRKFQEKLKSTESALLYHTVRDKYWGIGQESWEIQHPMTHITGENIHGELLAEVRSAINDARMIPQERAKTDDRYQRDADKTMDKSRMKPKVTLVGNSLLNGIVPRALTKKCDVKIARVGTASQAKHLIENIDPRDRPDIIGLQLITNEARDVNNVPEAAQQCTSDIVDIISDNKDTEFIVCLAPSRGDNRRSQEIQDIVNNNLHFILHEKDNVHLIELNDLNFHECYNEDRIHFNDRGSSILASRYKRVIHELIT